MAVATVPKSLWPRVCGETSAPPVWKGNAGSAFPPCVFPTTRNLNAMAIADMPRVETSRLFDKYGRAITDLRIAVTDRCNYKCVYCRAGNDGAQYPDLPIDVYLRMARIFVSLGIEKIRLTGGEPLLRKGIVDLIHELSLLRTLDDRPLDLAVTTNGDLLAEMAGSLKKAGLNRVTVSMDAIDPGKFARITRVPNGYENVLAGIREAKRVGLAPIKVNCVLLRGFNEDQIIPFGRFAREEGVVIRFIEFMPLEEDRVWTPEVVVTLDEILRVMADFIPLVEIEHARSETARRYRFVDGIGEIGIIAPVSHPFCGHCSRVRLTSDGKIRTCLFSVLEHDLYQRVRSGANDNELAGYIRGVVMQKEARHHIGEPDFVPASRTMVHIGG
jgi:cyclic pyranopterin phosphate synthase